MTSTKGLAAQPEELPVLEIDDLSAGMHGRYVDVWLAAVACEETALAYDDWLQCVLEGRTLSSEPSRRVRIRQGAIVFELEHGAEYEVHDPVREARRFQCLLDSDSPLIAFIGQVTGARYPWVTINNLFTISELRSLRRIK
ncbi:hypothetical protein [Cupriavidus pinatubonensis]|uniref:Uncharacterized protein n=1 Tax=Cupriavidus pinatubonensis TaxID=248026 RepID=A0ABN7Y8X4_9BURK|nr:hypothetical protein [Cupriavidus pinatubonensis]CAG9169839.1 hypothetical protein LMG23994_01689 [Cupriavidus pinatubonensis]